MLKEIIIFFIQPQPRLQSWFADEDLVVKELYQKQKQHVWTSPMLKLRSQLEKQLGE